VVETVWASPGAAPISNKFVAERKMIGSFLQETIQPPPGSATPDIRRIFYLSFNRVEGRWKYVFIDTRNGAVDGNRTTSKAWEASNKNLKTLELAALSGFRCGPNPLASLR
jgi:hypothetical protein